MPPARMISRLFVVLSALAFCGPAFAANIYNTGTLDFETSDQSMWDTGDAFIFDRTGDNVIFAGTTWNETASLDAIFGGVDEVVIIPSVCAPDWLGGGCTGEVTQTVDLRSGFEADIQTNGRVGFEIGLKIDSGSVNAQLGYDALLMLPNTRDVKPGQFVDLAATSTNIDTNAIQTTFPTIEGSLSLVAEAHAEFGIVGCVALLGCTPRGELAFDVGGTQELVSFNQDGEGGIEYFDGDPILNTLLDIGTQAAGVSLPDGFPGSIPVVLGKDPATQTPRNIGEVVLHLPQPDTEGGLSNGTIKSTAADDFLDFNLDIDNLISLATTAAASSGATVNSELFNPGGSIDIGDLKATAEFTILDFDLIPNLDLRQSFELVPTLMVDLAFSNPVKIAGFADPMTTFTSAWNELPEIAFLSRGDTVVTPTFWMAAMLTNELSLDANIQAVLDLLTVQFGLEAYGISIPVGDPIGIGNVFDNEADLFTTPPLFSREFALAGFDPLIGPAFTVTVPAPGSLLLLVVGLLALSGVERRNRRDERAC